ncbi:MAG: hypothetical protein U5K77_01950 [Candidatus Saccharibacteria bacterium]|nr:hypothetical protein [Candidatus Saccharibacteria bacterium]
MKTLHKYLSITLLTVLVLSGIFTTLQTTPTSALSGSQFNPERIMDDTVFFRAGDLTVSQIQTFLNSKVPVCDTDGEKSRSYYYNPDTGEVNNRDGEWNGDQWVTTSRAIYGQRVYDDLGPTYGSRAPYTCLKDYRINTPSKPAESGLCKAISSKSDQPAAQIIHDVSKACGVSTRVLLVLLQKEQSLIKDTWPWGIQYTKATGYGCPDTKLSSKVDSNQNGCYDQYEGFFNQVYYAGRVYKHYDKVDGPNYRVGFVNYVQYNPNTGCGGTDLLLRSQATAGLYNYTPYQPNKAALDNLYGTGNGCSAYGNRNFWRMYNDWFGSTHSNIDYGWSLETSEVYINSQRTTKFTKKDISLLPGETAYIRVKVHNIGNKSWTQSKTHLGTWNKQDRSSIFADESWLSSTRASKLAETEVVPGTFGTYEFSITAPQELGTYKESFNMVVEGKKWMKANGLTFTVHVTSELNPANTKNILEPGEQINFGEHLLSSDRYNVLRLEKKSLRLMSSFEEIWQKSPHNQLKRLVMQGDGNLVLYNTSGNPVWHTGTYGNAGAWFAVQHDGNMVVYSEDNVPLWASNTVQRPHMLKHVTPTLPAYKLFPGQKLETADRKRKLVIQSDGNLVLYDQGKALWATYTVGENIKYLAMQSDGNLVLYNTDGDPVWYTNTNGMGSSRLVLQEDNNLVLYRKSTGRPTWHTGTY